MMDAILQFNVTNQEIERTDEFVVVESSENYLQAQFTFKTPDWDGMVKTGVFIDGDGTAHPSLCTGDICIVPAAWLKEQKGAVGVVGSNGQTKITTNAARVRIYSKGYAGENLEEESESYFDQIMQSFKDTADFVTAEANRAGDAASQAGQYAQQAEKDAAKAAGDREAAEEAIAGFGIVHQQAVADVNNAGQTQTERVQEAGNSALDDIGTARNNALSAIGATGEAQTQAVSDAGAAQTKAVNDAGAAQVSTITGEGEAQVAKVREAAEGIIADRDLIEQNQEDIMKATITQMSAGKGIMMTDSAEMPFVGLRQYGHTTQQTTTGAQLLDAKDFKNSELNGVKYEVLEDGGIHITGETETYSYINPVFLNLEPGTYTASAKDKKNGVHVYISKREPEGIWEDAEGALTISETDDARIYVRVDRNIAYDTVIYPMLNAGSTALPWEPYTGGKPSPNPDYPQELISAGDKGNVELQVEGKNLLDGQLYYAEYGKGIFYLKNKDTAELPYSPAFEVKGVCKIARCKRGVSYTFTVKNPNNNATLGIAEYKNLDTALSPDDSIGFYNAGENKASITYIAKNDGILVCGIAGIWTDNVTTLHVCTADELLQLEIGDKATGYEPPRPIQTLTHSTPNGLPGIPVSSGGNYTDDNGQQWIADYRDWERGVDVQRVWKGVFDGSSDEEWSVYDNPSYFGFYLMNALPINADRRNGYCNQFRIDVIGTEIDNGLWIGASGNKYMYAIRNSFYNDVLGDKGLANWKAHLAEHPLEVMTYLDIPIETPIPPEELAAYRELHTNYPATTIHNDEDCWMEAGYTADPKNHISQHYAAKEDYESLEQRVLALEANALNSI